MTFWVVLGPGGRYTADRSLGTGLVAPSLDLPPRKVPRRVQVQYSTDRKVQIGGYRYSTVHTGGYR